MTMQHDILVHLALLAFGIAMASVSILFFGA